MRVLAIATLVLVLCIAFRGAEGAVATNAGANSIGPSSTPPCAAQDVTASALQQTVHHAGLVVVFPAGRVETRCVEFDGDSISGTQLLQESGLTIVFSSFGGGLGAGVCRIDDVGCSDPGNCFCQCQGASCAFWSYFKLDGAVWGYESVGPATRRLHDGDTDGWVWGSGHAGPGDSRAPCPLAHPTPVPTPTPAAPAVAPPPPSSDGSSGDSSNTVNATSPQVAAGETTIITARPSATPAVATWTPPPQVAAREQSGDVNSTAASKKNSGGGPPAGLIAFGAVAGVLVAGIGGIALRRRFVD